MTTNYKAIENRCGKGGKVACYCGKKTRLIPYCGFYICVHCRTGLERVSRTIVGLGRLNRKVA